MSSDLTAPGYRPQYNDGADLGDVGSGRALGASLYELYRAGRIDVPAVASVYARLTNRVDLLRDAMKAQFTRPGLGPAKAHSALLELREEVHDVLRQTCLRLAEAGEALVKIADAYAATDEQAAAEFDALLARNSDSYAHPAISVPTLPSPTDPPSSSSSRGGW